LNWLPIKTPFIQRVKPELCVDCSHSFLLEGRIETAKKKNL